VRGTVASLPHGGSSRYEQVLQWQSGWATKSVPGAIGGSGIEQQCTMPSGERRSGGKGGCSAVGLAEQNSTARRLASSSCCSSSKATEKSRTVASECRRLVCEHEAGGWRAVALIVQSDLTACGCACRGSLSLRAAGEIVLVMSGAMQGKVSSFSRPPAASAAPSQQHAAAIERAHQRLAPLRGRAAAVRRVCCGVQMRWRQTFCAWSRQKRPCACVSTHAAASITHSPAPLMCASLPTCAILCGCVVVAQAGQ
jgi:hypothetical protein